MSEFLAHVIIVFFLTIITGLPRVGCQYNYASSDGVKKVLDRDLNGDGKTDLLVGQQSGAVLLHLNNTK